MSCPTGHADNRRYLASDGGSFRPALVLICAIALAAPPAWAREPSHGLSYFGDLKYPADVAHFDYANPDAPKGGRIKLPSIGTFNNLNPYVDKGLL
ncbi:MAG: hypothetical protein OXT64_16010, partial [Gammaproteobacteria bacterium]|nr:hypothetical protein [Gammaproteobacteria bacterium]